MESHDRRYASALLIILGIFALSGLALALSPYSYDAIDLSQTNRPPSLSHPLGTDDLGRDLSTRIACGVSISLLVAVCAALIDCFVGVLWGGIAGYIGGAVEEAMMRIVDIVTALPTTMITIILLLLCGSGLLPMVLALALAGWSTMARVTRAAARQLSQEEYVSAALLSGAGPFRVLLKHLLPNMTPAIVTTLLMTIPYAIFLEAFLGFIGLGVAPPLASLGTLTYEGLPALAYYPWRLVAPALSVTGLVLVFHLLGHRQRGDRLMVIPHG